MTGSICDISTTSFFPAKPLGCYGDSGAIFTDDDKDNAAAAFKAGVTGIQFKNVKSFCKMLVTYGIDI